MEYSQERKWKKIIYAETNPGGRGFSRAALAAAAGAVPQPADPAWANFLDAKYGPESGRSDRSPHGAKRNAGSHIAMSAPDFAPLHPGYGCSDLMTVAFCHDKMSL
jgi:hypothetical protein